jgi:lipid-binding SYLF domain-containing protein
MSAWEKTKHGSKSAFDKAWAGFEKLGAPVNKFTNKIGSEAFWPTTLDHESDKAARILKSFCSMFFSPVLKINWQETEDGFYKEEPASPGAKGPKNKPKVLVKIPQKVIQNCVGLAIFTVMRTGLWVSGAGGSGVLIARKEDGTWSPPSGILIHTLGVGFMAGIDIYDCVVVINDRKALEAFSKVRVSLGGEISVVAGPVGAGGVLESEVMKDRKPLWSYMKSRGLYGGIQLDGTIIIERNDENARFYGERLPISQILAGNVRRVPPETRMLTEVVKQAEGRTDVDYGVLDQAAQHPPPSDIPVEKINEPTQEQMHQYAPPPNFHDQSQYYPPPPNAQGASYYHDSHDQGPAYPPRPTSQGQSQSSTPPQQGQAPYYPPPPNPQGQTPHYPPPPGAPPGYASSSGGDQILGSGGPPTHDQKESYGPRYS